MSEIEQRLEELEELGLRRSLRMVSGPQGPRVLLDGKPVLMVCSNNYLGLADHPRVREAAAEAAMRWGVGAGASRLVSGTMTIHRRLEERIAAFEGSEACVLFGSGYLANVGAIGALAGRGDTVFSDELNHASIIDGCRLSRADVVVYRHRDMEHLEWLMHRRRNGRVTRPTVRSGERLGAGRSGAAGSDGGQVVVSDSVFSMDGDTAPLEELVELAGAYGARTIVDEAHAIGTIGPGGRGAIAAAGLEGEVDIVIGTLGKALGSYGAFALASKTTIDYLINVARSLIFSTAPPPPAIAGALAALELLEEKPHRVQRLRSNARVLRRALATEGFPVKDVEMHIVPLVAGEERAACALCEGVLRRGVFAQAIRPPTVAPGTSRLRLATMASHTADELVGAARAIGDAARELELDPAKMGAPLAESRADGDGADRGVRTATCGPRPCGPRRRGRGRAARARVRRAGQGERSVRPRARDPDTRDSNRLQGSLEPPTTRASVRGLFVTGTDTGAGKTVLSAALLAAMARGGEPVRAYKPVVTGLDEPSGDSGDSRDSRESRESEESGESGGSGEWPADHVLLAGAAGMRPEEVSPLRYGPAVSPHLAAELAGERIDPGEVIARAHEAGADGVTLIVEGVGGLLVPLTSDFTVCDLAASLGLPVLIAARPGLGTINHTLLTLAAARAAGLDVRAVVLTPWPAEPSQLEHSNRETIAELGAVEVACLAQVSSSAMADLAQAGDALPWRRWCQPESFSPRPLRPPQPQPHARGRRWR